MQCIATVPDTNGIVIVLQSIYWRLVRVNDKRPKIPDPHMQLSNLARCLIVTVRFAPDPFSWVPS